MKAETHATWIARVNLMLRDGFGVEDIAVLCGYRVEDVRLEVEILRAEGHLPAMFRRVVT